ncbi:hypothetical protein [Actinoplanes palleronii]|uniref:hypothetical protein n=1 Tax=Actinoplanes palleronii TaxID=113570 RepID=UPI001943594E|nr:hypothetical protein [Actinoplanes palleronii]
MMATGKIGLAVVSPSLFLIVNGVFNLGLAAAKHLAISTHRKSPERDAVHRRGPRRRQLHRVHRRLPRFRRGRNRAVHVPAPVDPPPG